MFCARCGARLGLQDTTCPKCSLDLSLAGAVRLTNPALGGNRYNAVPRVPRRDVPPRNGDDRDDENAVTRVIPSMPMDPDATMVRPLPSADRGPGPQTRRPAGGSADTEATQVLPVSGPTPAPGRPVNGVGGRAATGRDDEQWVPTRQRPQASSGAQDPPRPQAPSRAAVPRPGQYEDPTLPPTWFRDPEAEHTRAMRSPVPPQQPVFTPPPTPVSPPEPVSPHGREPHDRRWVVVIILVLILTFLILGVVVWWILGGSMTKKEAGPAVSGSPTSSSSLLGSPQVSGPTDAGSSISQQTSTAASPSSAAASLPASAKQCSSSVGAGGDTSCQFAQNVAAAIPAGASGDVVVQASSPVTGKSYTMTCKAGAVTVCQGGNNAEVYVIR